MSWDCLRSVDDSARLRVIVPSRGRPQNIARLAQVFQRPDCEAALVVALDDDDPELPRYRNLYQELDEPGSIYWGEFPRLRLVPTLNMAAAAWTADPTDEFVGFMGDDHYPRTPYWDRAICAALSEPGVGIVYGNDLLQGENLPTAVFMRASIVRALGYFAPPGLIHLFADNAWLTWGRQAGCLRYLPDVIIEHLHPLAGKAEQDSGYAEANAGAVWDHDKAVWELYERTTLAGDVDKIKAAMTE